MNQYLCKIDSLLKTHAPLKKLNKEELEFLNKPWIAQGLQNYIKKNNNTYSKFVKCKNKKLKEFYHSDYYRNLLPTFLKRAKEKYFTKFFNENIKDVKTTWIGIKSLVSMKHKNNDAPFIIRNDEKYINDLSQSQILSITFSHQLLRLFSHKSSSQKNPLEVFYHQKTITLL